MSPRRRREPPQRPRTISACNGRSWSALRAAAEAELPALPVVFAYLYGSRAAGQQRAARDVDVGIQLGAAVEHPETLASRVADALARRSGVRRTEATVLNDAPLRFLGRVLRRRVVLYSRDEWTTAGWSRSCAHGSTT